MNFCCLQGTTLSGNVCMGKMLRREMADKRAFMEPGPAIGSKVAVEAGAVRACCPGEDALHHTHWLARCMERRVAEESQQ